MNDDIHALRTVDTAPCRTCGVPANVRRAYWRGDPACPTCGKPPYYPASPFAAAPDAMPFEDWGYQPGRDEEQHPRGLNDRGDLCPDCNGEGGDVMDPDNYWICDRCHGCGYVPPCEVHAPKGGNQ